MTDMQNDEPINHLILSRPNRFGLPVLDHNRRVECQTYQLVDRVWPEVELLIDQRQVTAAIETMTSLAQEMHELMHQDPEPWRQTLVLARQALYDELKTVAEWAEVPGQAKQAFEHCLTWDEELQSYLSELIASIEGV